MPLRSLSAVAAVLSVCTALLLVFLVRQLDQASQRREAWFHTPCRGTLIEGYSGNDPVRLCVPRSP